MKKVIDFLATVFLVIIYLMCCIIMVPIFWKGQPAFKYWIQDRDTKDWTSPRTRQIVALAVILIFIWCWWVCLSLVAASWGYYLYRSRRSRSLDSLKK